MKRSYYGRIYLLATGVEHMSPCLWWVVDVYVHTHQAPKHTNVRKED